MRDLNALSEDEDKAVGAVLGTAIGDAICAPYEGGLLERLLWRLIGTDSSGRKRWTDDTQMTIDVLESLIEHGGINQDALAIKFAASYKWSRGYGPGAAKILKRIKRGTHWSQANCSVYKDGSFGNGAAMRVAPISIFYKSRMSDLMDAVQASAVITHAHPLAVSGAKIIARATHHGLCQESNWDFLQDIQDLNLEDSYTDKIDDALAMGKSAAPKLLAKRLGNGISALESCVTAVYCAQRFVDDPLADMLEFIQKIGGDTDTIASMACAIWGAARGARSFGSDLVQQVERSEEILSACLNLCEHRKMLK